MGFYRKKPVVIEALQFHQKGDHPEVVVALKDKSTGAIIGFSAPFSQETRAVFAIKTREGWREVMPGDWIIRGIKGEFYPCKPDVFAETYEESTSETRRVAKVEEADLKDYEAMEPR